ncbi:MAG: S1C family serine protease [Propionibacteriaceae bacterium]|jgi:S1-C subfamily serine protease|nr:S1C family serine protease [Propionibacteriaceae bacterium]
MSLRTTLLATVAAAALVTTFTAPLAVADAAEWGAPASQSAQALDSAASTINASTDWTEFFLPGFPQRWSGGSQSWPTLPNGQGNGSGQQGDDSSGSTSNSTSSPATEAQSQGVVLINTEVSYGQGKAAGTGMVIDSGGIVVTNHHVVANSTDVTVTVPSTNQTYTAEVLGYDAASDVAVLRLNGASGLTAVTPADDDVSPGQSITAVGNANGEGELVAATGTVTATNQDITVREDDGSQAQLTDLIEMNAGIVPGDSGGAVFDESGEVVGMNVAGSSDERDDTGYAIPMDTVMDVANTVLNGTATDKVSLGRTGALGVTVSLQAAGIRVAGVVEDGPADQAGVTAGSTITKLDGTALSTTSDLTAALTGHKPGDQVSLEWTDASGVAHQAIVTLTTAPLA